jgi:6-pyruvoyltetrahydropterin/6-carboxytetrahydropterin synthase
MYEISVRDHFSAAHSLADIGGKCEKLHGHNFKVELFLRSDKLQGDGAVMDFRELKSMLKEILEGLDHTNLNDVPPFDKINPSSENIGEYILKRVKAKLEKLNISGKLRVDVWESDTSRASYFED